MWYGAFRLSTSSTLSCLRFLCLSLRSVFRLQIFLHRCFQLSHTQLPSSSLAGIPRSSLPAPPSSLPVPQFLRSRLATEPVSVNVLEAGPRQRQRPWSCTPLLSPSTPMLLSSSRLGIGRTTTARTSPPPQSRQPRREHCNGVVGF